VARRARLFGRRDFQVGDPEFDEKFELATSEAGFALRILHPEMRSVLRSVSLAGDFYWRVSRGGFLPRSARELVGWLVAAFQLLDALPGVEGAGRMTVGEARIEIREDASCQICGCGLSGGRVVSCAKCSRTWPKQPPEPQPAPAIIAWLLGLLR
jgi:hypothetical protein